MHSCEYPLVNAGRMLAAYMPEFRLLRGDFEVSRFTGATRCTNRVKFGMDESNFGQLLCSKFHPHWSRSWGMEYKRPAGVCPVCDSYEFF